MRVVANWFQRLRDRWRRRERSPTLVEQYEKIAKEIDPYDLQRSSHDLSITDADLFADLNQPYQSHRISDYYSEEGFKFALERYGLLDKVRTRGFTDLRFAIELGDQERQHIGLFGTKDGHEHLLMDLMMGRIRRKAPEGLDAPDDLSLLSIEWMMLQNPAEEFSPEHPRWPGQDHPGLGLNADVMLLHVMSAKRLGLDGVVNHPSRYHVAFIGGGRVWFLDPSVQGWFDALREALSSADLTDATWMMERGEVRWADEGTAIQWLPEDLVVPTSDRLAAYFRSSFYEEPRAESYARAKARGIMIASQTER